MTAEILKGSFCVITEIRKDIRVQDVPKRNRRMKQNC